MTIENEGFTFLWNVWKHSPNNMASHPKKLGILIHIAVMT